MATWHCHTLAPDPRELTRDVHKRVCLLRLRIRLGAVRHATQEGRVRYRRASGQLELILIAARAVMARRRVRARSDARGPPARMILTTRWSSQSTPSWTSLSFSDPGGESTFFDFRAILQAAIASHPPEGLARPCAGVARPTWQPRGPGAPQTTPPVGALTRSPALAAPVARPRAHAALEEALRHGHPAAAARHSHAPGTRKTGVQQTPSA